MKGKVIVLFSVLVMFAQSVVAGNLLEVKIGSWKPDYSGDIGVSGNEVTFDELGYDDFDHDIIMATLRHPVPLVPNVQMEIVDLESNGVGEISATLELDGITYSANETVTSAIDLSFTDITLFYTPLSTLATVDVGLTLRNFDGSIRATGSVTTSEADVEFDGWVPLLYGAVKIDLPLTGVYLRASGSFISVDDNSISDYTAAVGYAHEFTATELIAELGTRIFNIKAEDVDDVDDQDFDLDIDGLFFNVGLRF